MSTVLAIMASMLGGVAICNYFEGRRQKRALEARGGCWKCGDLVCQHPVEHHRV